jgi:acetylornithine/N-succinyldiaminopimelate aminotransferase
VYLHATDGRKLLDFASGIAVNSLGHCHPHLVQTLKDQAEKLWHVSNLYQIPGQQRLAERLVAISPCDTVFFCNSGAEATECAIKMVRHHHYARGQAQKNRIITFEGAFHGRTIATISATNKPALQEGFAPLLDGFDVVAFNDLDAVKAAVTPHTAGIMLETIQGEGGIRVASEAFLKGLRRLCDENDLLLVLDEVQCGVGRTGKFFAFEHAGVMPDIIPIAKGIGGGFPLGACLANEHAALGMGFGVHGGTYGGNPLAMAVGNAVLDVVLAPGFMEHVVAMGQYLHQTLTRLAQRYQGLLYEVRGQGLMLGLKTVGEPAAFVAELRKIGLLTVAASDNIIRVVPPLIVTREHIDEAAGLMERACQNLG